jgi:hypothetical protein
VIDEYILRYINKTGLTRDVISESSGAKSVGDLVIYPLFGDLHSVIFVGQVLIDKVVNPQKHNVVLTWPGLEKLINGVNEVWSLSTSYNYQAFHNQAYGMENNGAAKNVLIRSLNENFVNIDNLQKIKEKYNHTIKRKFLEEKPFTLKSFPCVPASSLNGIEKSNKKKVFIFPFSTHKHIKENSIVHEVVDPQIYIEIIRRLLSYGFHVFCVQNDWTANIKDDVISSEITYIVDNDFERLISYAKYAGCFLDIFNDLQIIGLMAQVPVFSLYERNFFYEAKKDLEREIFDFTNKNKIVFSFLSMFKKMVNLNIDFCNSIIDRFDDFYTKMVLNSYKLSVPDKHVDVSGYVSDRVKRYRPKFITSMLEQKEREKNA